MSSKEVSLIAGNGEFPRMFIEAAHARGVRVSVAALKGEAERGLAKIADAFAWIEIGKFQALVDCLKSFAGHDVAMAGGISKLRFFMPQRPDARALKVAANLVSKKDDGILRAIARELEQEGLAVIASTQYLGEAMAPAGVLTARGPTAGERDDLAFGFALAKEIGRADVGQTVVVKERIPLAVEGIEGTDRCIARGGALGRGGGAVVKVVKPGQDLRFDLPAVGPRTIKTLKAARIKALGVEAGQVLLIEKRKLLAAADAAGITVVGLAG